MGKKDKMLQLLLLDTMKSHTKQLIDDERELNNYLDFFLAKPCWQKHWR